MTFGYMTYQPTYQTISTAKQRVVSLFRFLESLGGFYRLTRLFQICTGYLASLDQIICRLENIR